MNFMVLIGIFLLYTYATAIAAPSPLRYENPKSNLTLPLALSTTTNDLPPDPNLLNIPSIGLVRCYSYEYTPWEVDILHVLILATITTRVQLDHGQGNRQVYHPQRYTRGHATFSLDPSISLTWQKWLFVLHFLALNAQDFTPGTFLFLVSEGPTGIWNGSLTTT